MFYNISLIIVSNTFSEGAIKYKLLSTNTGGNGNVSLPITTIKHIPTAESIIPIDNGKFTGPTNGNKVLII